MFYERVTGRKTVLIFVPPIQPPLRPPVLLACEKALDDFAAVGVDPFLIDVMPPAAVQAMKPKTRFWADPEGKTTDALLTQLGAGDRNALAQGPVAAVLDSNQRLITVLTGDDLPGLILNVYAGRTHGRTEKSQGPARRF